MGHALLSGWEGQKLFTYLRPSFRSVQSNPSVTVKEIKAMTPNERITLIEVKIERAKKHIVDLESEIKTFFDSKPYEIRANYNPQMGKLGHYVVRADPVPNSIPATAGDAIHNLRSVIDHIAQQLFLIGPNGEAGSKSWHKFIVRDSASDFEAALKGVIKDLRPDAIDVFRSIEPYKGGKGHELWVLHQLDIIDKHRLLITVGSAFQSVDLMPYLSNLWDRSRETFGGKDHPFANFPPYFIRPADNLFPLKAGDVLFGGSGDEEVDKKMQFRFNIALNEPGVVEGKPLFETIQHLSDLVSNTFHIFKPCLV